MTKEFSKFASISVQTQTHSNGNLILGLIVGKRPIIVTGAHRSGTSWTGAIIAFAPGVRYVNEPFNVEFYTDYSPVRRCYHYFSEQTKPHRQDDVRRFINSFVGFPPGRLLKDLFKVRSFHKLYVYFADKFLRIYSRPLFKDPFMLFSAPWLAKEYDADVVVTIRHPAAFIASLKVKDWHFDFGHFAAQRRLMREDILHPYREQIFDFAENQKDIISHGILLWNCLYYKVKEYKEKYGKGDKWYFIRHEDLSLDPQGEFKKIFDYFGLKFSERVKNQITATSTSSEHTKLKRNSAENVKTWQKRLTPEEISRIKEGTREIWEYFYDEKDWD